MISSQEPLVSAKWRITWDYHGCVIFNIGDRVYYRKIDDILQFWHPGKECWTRSMHPKIPVKRAKNGVVEILIKYAD